MRFATLAPALAAALLAAGCAAATASGPAPATTAATPAWDSASFTMSSWGQPVTSWTIMADGSGTWSRSTPRDGNFADRETTSRTLPADAAAAGALAATLARLPATPPSGENCKERITDQPYGALTITIGGQVKQYRYDAGCLDRAYVRFINVLREADGQVARRGEASG